MTTAQKNGLRYAAAILGAAVTIATSAAMMRRDVQAKEDRADHVADMREERSARELQHVRDSATMSVILERVTDVSCQQNPTQRYCR